MLQFTGFQIIIRRRSIQNCLGLDLEKKGKNLRTFLRKLQIKGIRAP